jgi:hypothetical protein
VPQDAPQPFPILNSHRLENYGFSSPTPTKSSNRSSLDQSFGFSPTVTEGVPQFGWPKGTLDWPLPIFA